ncbi:M91 family zinc metallopeptidase, partial [Flavobacterium columnare]|uniref:M91 family zinc metallopeptidase n=1 Tax=Flavobacterium columnare TaxID=996 RepID=UPI00201338BF
YFLSIDPLAEKFPNWSPYCFVMNNPLRLIDPTGMAPEDIIIIGNNKQQLKYENGNLFNKDGSAYTGKVDKFTQKTVDALGQISKSAEGSAMIQELQSSKNEFTISKGASEFNETDRYKGYANQLATDPSAKNSFDALTKMGIDMTGGSGGAVTWDPSGGSIPTTAGMKTNATIDLSHEMFHALDSNRGMLDDRRENGVKRDEYQAVFRENNLRGQLNLPLRTHYQTTFDINGMKTSYGPSMLNNSNQNVKPLWYKP